LSTNFLISLLIWWSQAADVMAFWDPFGATLSFTTALAAGGQRFFADDRLFLDLTPVLLAGHSLAIAPKLRLPLPVDADVAHRDFVTQKSVLN